jgi:hypothetical protein
MLCTLELQKLLQTHGYENYYLKSILQIFKTYCLFIYYPDSFGRCWGQAGTLDESFGDGGKVIEDIGRGDQISLFHCCSKRSKDCLFRYYC